MAFSYASNAITAKARTMYGKRLTAKDYASLLSCSTVAEVLSYLKGHTKYAPLLNNVSERNVHRGQLELILRQQLFYDFAALCRYEISAGEHFSQYIIMRTGIEQIMHFLMLYSSGRAEEYLYVLPTYFDSHTTIDLKALSKARTYDEFLDALGTHSKFRAILSGFRPKDGEPPDMPAIENALYTYLYETVFEIIDQYTKGKQKQELRHIFTSHIDLTNFVRILRLKKYYHLDSDKIKAQLLPFGTLRDAQLDAMCSAESSKEVFSIMESTPAGRAISKMEYNYAGEISERGKYNLGRKNIHFSNYPTVVLMSYIFLEEEELSNVINIIEGVRYKVDPDTIKNLLIYS